MYSVGKKEIPVLERTGFVKLNVSENYIKNTLQVSAECLTTYKLISRGSCSGERISWKTRYRTDNMHLSLVIKNHFAFSAL